MFYVQKYLQNLLLLYLVVLPFKVIEATEKLNLTARCTDTQLYYCTLVNLIASYGEAILLTNSNQKNLSTLVLRDSRLRRVPRELLQHVPQLRSLYMHNCALSSLSSQDFSNSPNLRLLLLQDNYFFTLAERQFSGLDFLEQLHLSRNTIRMLHKKTFSGLNKLRYLDLQQNNIAELPENVFSELLVLEHLDLSSNHITIIDEKTFAHNLQLQILLLGRNPFTVFEPRSLENLRQLKLLNISYSAVEEVNLNNIDTLVAENCGLKACSIIQGVVKVQANNNLLKRGSLIIGNKLNVRELHLQFNELESLDDFSGMWNLAYLDVSHNELGSLNFSHENNILPLPSLIYLNLTSNRLQHLSLNNFLLLSKLRTLDLAFNELEELDLMVLQPLTYLQQLYIENNNIKSYNFDLLLKNNKRLLEFGLYNNKYELTFLSSMLEFLKQQGVEVPIRFPKRNALPPTTDLILPQQSTQLFGATSIHPYWTKKDALTLATLCFVLLIMIMQIYRLCQEEPCLRDCCIRWRWAHRVPVVGAQNRPHVLHEEDSEISESLVL